jgi:hypothetical protein
MAFTPDHTEGNELTWTDASPAKGVTSYAVIDAGDGAYFEYVNIGLSVQMDGNIDGDGVDVQTIFSPNSGTLMPDANITLFNIAAAEATPKYQIKLLKFNYAKIGIFNNTTTEGEVTPTGWWEGLKITDS